MTYYKNLYEQKEKQDEELLDGVDDVLVKKIKTEKQKFNNQVYDKVREDVQKIVRDLISNNQNDQLQTKDNHGQEGQIDRQMAVEFASQEVNVVVSQQDNVME